MHDQDRFIWVAKLDDDSLVYQRRTDPETGKEELTSYEELDKSRVVVFSLLDKHNEMQPAVTVEFDGDGEKLVWTRRVQMIPGGEKRIFHIIGKKGRYILAVNAQAAVFAMDNFSETNILFCPVKEK